MRLLTSTDNVALVFRAWAAIRGAEVRRKFSSAHVPALGTLAASAAAARSLRSKPMRKPVFTETLQLGIVVRNLEATMRRYVDDYGIGPWEVYEFDAGKAEISASTVSRSSAPGALPSPRSARCSGS